VYDFAVVLLMGLVIAKLVDLLRDLGMHGMWSIVTSFVLGIVAAYLFDFDLFAAWDIGVRENLGTLATGLVYGAAASAWHEVLGLVAGLGRKATDEAIELEAKAGPRAA
jgi:hypothetical protein